MFPDIEQSILDSLQSIFAKELQQDVTDYLSLRTLKQAPLQDDPTTTAPFLTYEPNVDEPTRPVRKGEEEEMYGCVEIGGPMRYLMFFRAQLGTPVAVSKEQARIDIAALVARAQKSLATHYDLAGVLVPGQACMSPDKMRMIEGANKYLIKDATVEVYGGESTWYGKATICWLYPVSWYVF